MGGGGGGAANQYRVKNPFHIFDSVRSPDNIFTDRGAFSTTQINMFLPMVFFSSQPFFLAFAQTFHRPDIPGKNHDFYILIFMYAARAVGMRLSLASGVASFFENDL